MPSLAKTAAGYVALALTGCVAVAVLGARRPGAAAWNLVVGGLLVVLLLPLAEGALIGTPIHLGTFRTTFLAAVLIKAVSRHEGNIFSEC